MHSAYSRMAACATVVTLCTWAVWWAVGLCDSSAPRSRECGLVHLLFHLPSLDLTHGGPRLPWGARTSSSSSSSSYSSSSSLSPVWSSCFSNNPHFTDTSSASLNPNSDPDSGSHLNCDPVSLWWSAAFFSCRLGRVFLPEQQYQHTSKAEQMTNET